MSTLHLTVAGLLALAAVLGTWRSARQHGWREIVVWLQAPAALLLYLTLYPPQFERRADTLVVLTPGTPADAALPAGIVVALPGAAPERPRVEQFPDLATALRRYPKAGLLHVLGDGLPARDAPAAAGHAIGFEAPTLNGVVEVGEDDRGEPRPYVGRQWHLRGKVEGPVTQVELLDPAGVTVDQSRPDADGQFSLSAPLRGSGAMAFQVRAADADGQAVDHVTIPTVVLPSPPQPRVLLRAATPDADLKYLRRWAVDAGLELAARVGLSTDLHIGSDAAAFTTQTLSEADVAIIDERAWAGLSPVERTALLGAVQQGLGLMLRVTGPLNPDVIADWTTLGFSGLSNLEKPTDVTLDRALGLNNRQSFSTAPIRFQAAGLQTLLSADDGTPIAAVAKAGDGRVMLWTLLDAYTLRLLGQPARHATLWADALSAVVRSQPHTSKPAAPIAVARIDQRQMFCDLGASARLVGADGISQTLYPGLDRCAVAWPSSAGWQQMETGKSQRWVYVRDVDDGNALEAAARRSATVAMAGKTAAGGVATPGINTPWPRWPFGLTALFLVTGLWWRERVRRGS